MKKIIIVLFCLPMLAYSQDTVINQVNQFVLQKLQTINQQAKKDSLALIQSRSGKKVKLDSIAFVSDTAKRNRFLKIIQKLK